MAYFTTVVLLSGPNVVRGATHNEALECLQIL